MNINRTICPFNQRACINCTLYRGRHQCSKINSSINDLSVLNEIERMLNPETSNNSLASDLNIQIHYVNVEDMTSAYVSLSELKDLDLDWESTFMIRKIDGIHIYSWDVLMKTIQYKIETEGKPRVELVESPAHMLYGGGC